MPKTFPGEAPEPDSLNVQSGRGQIKDGLQADIYKKKARD